MPIRPAGSHPSSPLYLGRQCDPPRLCTSLEQHPCWPTRFSYLSHRREHQEIASEPGREAKNGLCTLGRPRVQNVSITQVTRAVWRILEVSEHSWGAGSHSKSLDSPARRAFVLHEAYQVNPHHPIGSLSLLGEIPESRARKNPRALLDVAQKEQKSE